MAAERPSVGFAGVGQLGSAMITRLLAEGFAVTAWNRTPTALSPLAARGARIADTPAELAKKCDILLTCVTDTEAVHQIIFGPGGFASAG